MTPLQRTLRWRVLRGGHWLDLVEERREGELVSYVGLIDGREALRSIDRRQAGSELLRRFVN